MRVKKKIRIDLDRKRKLLATIPPIIAKYEAKMAEHPHPETYAHLKAWELRRDDLTQEIAQLESQL